MRRIAINCGRNSGDGGIVCASITNGPNIIRVKEERGRRQRILSRYQVGIGDAVFTDKLRKAGVVVFAGQLNIAAAAKFESITGSFITIPHPVGINSAADFFRIASVGIRIHTAEVLREYLQQTLSTVVQVLDRSRKSRRLKSALCQEVSQSQIR